MNETDLPFVWAEHFPFIHVSDHSCKIDTPLLYFVPNMILSTGTQSSTKELKDFWPTLWEVDNQHCILFVSVYECLDAF